jgi:predicted O-methyltransferase YrrM
MESEKQTRLANAYVKHCFDSRIVTLPGSFTDERWHSSAIREFEYRQTERAIRKALGNRRYTRVLEIGPFTGFSALCLAERREISVMALARSG